MIKELYENIKKRKESGKSYKYHYKLAKLFLAVFYPIRARFKTNRLGIDENSDFIVSLTSYPARIDSVWLTTHSLLNQELRPASVELWLAKNAFPKGEKDLPKKLLKQKKQGLSIKFCDEDLRPHKKYYYAMKEHSESIIITADDDMLYPENMTKELMDTHKRYEDCICCTNSSIIGLDKEGQFTEYKTWETTKVGNKPSIRIIPIGCGGVLYPPHLLHNNLFNIDEIKELCLNTDDLWLKSMAVLNGIKAVQSRDVMLVYFNVAGTRKTRMSHTNVQEHRNDNAMKAISEKYPDVIKLLRDASEEQE